MSSLLYLKLDGIRSYCHIGQVKEENRKAAQLSQSIFFKKPLTLIWGHNGSGKTVQILFNKTIIEALRTITTGIHPPNSDKGRSFLTDSHLLGQSKTDACIELGFRSINDREIVARRHFSVVYDSPNSCKFSSLRSTLQTKSLETQKLETLHSSCANIEKQIPYFLGVSVPILSNVLLCHQEEQLWMFSDNSTLKGIFDELFETTDLVNIETRLRDQLKEAESKLKVLQEKADYSKRDIEDGQRQKCNLQTQLEVMNTEIETIQKIKIQIKTIQVTEIDFNQIQEKMSLCADLVACRNTVQENKSNLNLEYVDLNKISEQDFIVRSIKNLEYELKTSQSDLQQIEITLENKRNELSELQTETSFDLVKQEVKLIRDQIRTIFLFSNNLSDENLLKQMKDKLLQFQTQYQQEQSTLEQQEQNLRKKIENLNQLRQKCIIELKFNQQKLQEQIKLKEALNNQIKQKEQQQSNLIKQKRQAEVLEESYKEKQKLKLQFESVNQDLLECYDISQKNQIISQYLEIQTKIEELDVVIADKKQQIEILIRENGWKLTIKLNGSQLDKDLSLAKCEEQIKQKLSQIQAQIAKDQAQIKILLEQREEIQNQIQQNKSIKYNSQDLENVKTQLRESKENKIKYIFNQTDFIDQYIQNSKQTGKCLLCLKTTDQVCIEQLKQRVQSNLPKTKLKIQEFDTQINKLREQKKKIQAMIKNNEQLDRIKQIDDQIQQLQNSSRESLSSDNSAKLEKQLQDIMYLRQILKAEEEQQREQLIKQKIMLEQQNQYLKGANIKLINNQFNQSQLQKQKQEIAIKLKQYDGQPENFDNPKQLQDQISRLQIEISQLKQQFQNIIIPEFEEKPIELQQIEHQIEELENDSKIQKENQQEDLIKQKQIIYNLDQLIPQFEQKFLKKQELINKNRNNQKFFDYINRLQQDILQESEKMKRVEKNIIEKSALLKNYQAQLELIQKLIKWQEYDEQEDNFHDKIKLIQDEIQRLQAEYQKQQINKTQQDKLKMEFDLRKKKIESELEQKLDARKDISKRYDGSEIKRLDILSELMATQHVISDLKKYLQILETTMLECHGQKMKEINKYLFDTWQKIYNGNDIKFIEVKFDEIPNQKRISKKYNYRLVMRTLNNTEIDMKGRCSMGQKMLASIVFRMALAECFGSNCCFLALDEPTSNLDRKHIKTLADQLNSLIELMQQHQQQIQLVIITHDMDLVKLLRKHSESYFMINKKENGFSTIEERRMEELK